jgi:hypothetical protein
MNNIISPWATSSIFPFPIFPFRPMPYVPPGFFRSWKAYVGSRLRSCHLAKIGGVPCPPSTLIFSSSHTGRVQQGFLDVFELRCVDFLLDIANVPHSAPSTFLFDDRRAGRLGASQLKQDADIWTIACAALLLDSQDPVFRLSAHSQLEQYISRDLGISHVEPSSTLSDFSCGSTRGGLYDS